MSAVRAFARRHPALSFYALVFAISWGGMLALVGPGGVPGSAEAVTRLFPIALVVLFAGPSVSGVVLTALTDGPAGVRALFAKLLSWRAHARWYLVALLTGPLLVAVVLGGLSLYSPVYIPGVLVTDAPLKLMLFSTAWGLIGGGFLEELGWTGFATRALREKHGVVATGLVVGLLWGAWHLLIAFWSSEAMSAGRGQGEFILGFLSFYALALPAYRVLMVWVYSKTNRLPVAMLMHAVLSASTLILQPLTTDGTVVWNTMLGVALWVIVAIVAAFERRSSRRRLALAF